MYTCSQTSTFEVDCRTLLGVFDANQEHLWRHSQTYLFSHLQNYRWQLFEFIQHCGTCSICRETFVLRKALQPIFRLKLKSYGRQVSDDQSGTAVRTVVNNYNTTDYHLSDIH